MNQIIIDEQTIAHIKYEILGRSIYMISRYNDLFNCKIYYHYVRHNVMNIFADGPNYKLNFLQCETPLYTKGKRKHFQLYPTIYFDTPCISNYSINCWTRVRYEVHVNDSQTIPTIFAIFNEC